MIRLGRRAKGHHRSVSEVMVEIGATGLKTPRESVDIIRRARDHGIELLRLDGKHAKAARR